MTPRDRLEPLGGSGPRQDRGHVETRDPKTQMERFSKVPPNRGSWEACCLKHTSWAGQVLQGAIRNRHHIEASGKVRQQQHQKEKQEALRSRLHQAMAPELARSIPAPLSRED